MKAKLDAATARQSKTKTTHTPGPWFIQCTGGESECIASNHQTLDVEVNGPDFEIRNANARLIAAAPELLAACHVALATLDLKSMGRAKWTGGDQKSFDLLSAAIAKAEAR